MFQAYCGVCAITLILPLRSKVACFTCSTFSRLPFQAYFLEQIFFRDVEGAGNRTDNEIESAIFSRDYLPAEPFGELP